MGLLFAAITTFVSILNGAISQAPTRLAALTNAQHPGITQAADPVDLAGLTNAVETAAVPTPPPVPDPTKPSPVPDGKDGFSMVGTVAMQPVTFSAMVTSAQGNLDDPDNIQVKIESEGAGSFEVDVMSAMVGAVAEQLANTPDVRLTDFPIGLTLGPLSVQALISTVVHDVPFQPDAEEAACAAAPPINGP